MQQGDTKTNSPSGLAPIPIENVLKVPIMDGLLATQCADIFLKSEEFYVERALRVVSETFEFRLKNHLAVRRPVLEATEIQQVFLNITNIYEFNRKLYQELLSLRLDQKLLEGLGAVMTTHIPFFKLYTSYIKLYRKSLKFLDVLVEKKRPFREFLEINELCARLPLKTLLLAPVARMPQYLMFMGSIYRAMDQSSPAAHNLAAAIRAVQTATDDIAFSLRDQVARKLVVTVQQKIFGDSCDLVSPHRYVIKHGDLKKIYNKVARHVAHKKVYLFILFNDMLLYGLRGGRFTSGTVKHTLQLRGLTVTDVPNADRVKNAFKISSNTKSFVLCAPNAETKLSWMQSIKEQVDIHNRSESSLQKSALSGEAFERIIKKKATRQDLEILRQQQQVRIKPLGAGGAGAAPGTGPASSPAAFRSAGPPPGNPPGFTGGMPSPPPGNPPPPAGGPAGYSPYPPAGSPYPPSGNPPPPAGAPFPPSSPSSSPYPPGNPPPPAGAPSPYPPAAPPMMSQASFSSTKPSMNGYSTGSISSVSQDQEDYDGTGYSTTQGSLSSFSAPLPPQPPQPTGSPTSGFRPAAPPIPTASPTMGFRPPPPAAPPAPSSPNGHYGATGAAAQFAPPPMAPPSSFSPPAPPMAPSLSAPAPPMAPAMSAPAPPMAPPLAPAAPEAPPLTFDYSSTPSVSQNLLSAISSNKSKPGEWQEVLDPASGEYYYENTVTGESTWERPPEFDSQAAAIWGGNEHLQSAATEMDLQDTLVKSLNRYRQFVQDEEDDVQQQDTPDDEWD